MEVSVHPWRLTRGVDDGRKQGRCACKCRNIALRRGRCTELRSDVQDADSPRVSRRKSLPSALRSAVAAGGAAGYNSALSRHQGIEGHAARGSEKTCEKGRQGRQEGRSCEEAGCQEDRCEEGRRKEGRRKKGGQVG